MRQRLLIGIAATVAATAASAAAATRLSPWPGVWFLRWYVGRLDAEQVPARAAALRTMVPDGVRSDRDIRYGGRPLMRLDVYRPAGSGPLPTIVWVHGGGYIGGTKDDLAEYLQILAGRGFTVVGVDYTHAPTLTYPAQIHEIADAVRHVTANAAHLGVDPERMVLAGDSAGAHMAGQLAFAVADADYAAAAGLPRPVPAESLRALVLCCGPYDLLRRRVPGFAGWLARTVMWAYSGVRDPASDPRFAAASLVDHVPASLPATFLTCGNADPFRGDARRLLAALENADVTVDAQIYDDDHPRQLGHEYQIDLRLPEAVEAMDRMVALIERAVAG